MHMPLGWSAVRTIQVFSLILLAFGVFLVARQTGFAQIPLMPESVAEEIFEEPQENLASPRATMQTFLEAMGTIGEPDFATATQTIDLSGLPLISREVDGRRIANQLIDVINRTRIVNFDDLPVEIEENRWVFEEYYRPGTGELLGKIELRRNSIGEWRFSTDTVAAIGVIYDVWRERPLVAGFAGIDRIEADPAGWLRDQFPERFRQGVLGFQLWQLTTFFGLLLGGFVLGYVTRLVLFFVLRKRMDRSDKARATIRMFARGIVWFVGTHILQFGIPFLGAPAPIEAFLILVVKIIKALAVFWILLAIWKFSTSKFSENVSGLDRRSERLIFPVAIKAGQFVIFIGVGIWLISQIGYNVGGILAGLGIGGLILAFAAKDSVENFFGSLTIVLEVPFTIGDWVRIGDVDGEVEQIGLRSTRIRTFSDSLVTLPNSKLITSSVENFGARRHRRVRTTIGICYDTPIDKIEEFTGRIRQMMREDEDIFENRQFCYFNDFGEFSLDIMLSCYLIAPTWKEELEIRENLLRKIMMIAADMGVEFAFPTQTIVFDEDNAQQIGGVVQKFIPRNTTD